MEYTNFFYIYAYLTKLPCEILSSSRSRKLHLLYFRFYILLLEWLRIKEENIFWIAFDSLTMWKLLYWLHLSALMNRCIYASCQNQFSLFQAFNDSLTHIRLAWILLQQPRLTELIACKSHHSAHISY